jgi:hypothetical protein
MFAGRKLPTARLPAISIAVPTMISANPYMPRARAFNPVLHVVTANSPQAALAKAKEQVHEENAGECDNGYPWDTFTIESMDGAVVASEEPSKAPVAFTESVRELLAHIEDLASEFFYMP